MSVRITDAEWWSKRWMERAKLCQSMASSWQEYARLATMPSTDLDGYGAGGNGEGRSKGTYSDPVLALVERKEGAPDEFTYVPPDEWRDAEEDLTAKRLELLYAEAQNVDNAMRRMEGLKRLIDGRGDARVGRQSSVTDCLCCEATVTGVGEDRIKAGYCPRCYKAWQRYQAQHVEPVHELFRRHRRAEMVAESERAS